MKATRTFWSTANESFTAKERSEYNRFKLDLYLASDRLRDAINFKQAEQISEQASELHALILKMPSMEG